jgi:hypothetical protein
VSVPPDPPAAVFFAGWIGGDLAMIDPFPENAIAEFVTRASTAHRAWFAVASAQRGWTLAQDVLGAVRAQDREVIESALDASWSVLGSGDSGALAPWTPRLTERLVDEDDEDYGFYNSVVNDALTSAIYAIRAGQEAADASASARYAAQTFYNLVDLVLHRGRADYVDDLSAEPMIRYAVDCVERDTGSIPRLNGASDSAAYRDVCIADGHRISELAVSR